MGENLTIRSLPYDAEIEYLEDPGGTTTASIPYFIVSINSSHPGFGFYVNSYVFSNNPGHNPIAVPSNTSPQNRYQDWSILLASNYFCVTNIPPGQKGINQGKTGELTWKNKSDGTNRTITLTQNGNTLYNESFTHTDWTNNKEVIRINSFQWNRNARSKARIKLVQIFEFETLVHNIIPVRIGTTGYAYDKVTGQLFSNQGTGNFTLGPDIRIINRDKTLNTRIKNRYDTEENWLTENPILLSGEPAFTTVSGEQKSKVGDGETPYANLPYINNMGEAMIIRKWRD